MRYNVTATLGPASRYDTTWQAMLQAGVTAFRLNTSHLSVPEVEDWLARLKPTLQHASLVLDLQGSKWRLGDFSPFDLQEGRVVRLILAENSPQPGVLPVPHLDFFNAANSSNGEIALNDARQRLRIERQGIGELTARVTLGGQILPHKGITLADSGFRTETLSAKDQDIVNLGSQLPGVRFAISYVRDALEMTRYRRLLGAQTNLIAKVERGPAVEDVAKIAKLCDEIWVCRGDLGAELGLPGMAQAVYQVTRQLPGLPVPVQMAGQVLDYMTGHATPTRAEVCNLFDVLQAGYSGVVLSDETAVGLHPLQAVQAACMFLK